MNINTAPHLVYVLHIPESLYLFFYISLAYSDVYPLFVYVLIESILLFGVCVYNILLLFFS